MLTKNLKTIWLF